MYEICVAGILVPIEYWLLDVVERWRLRDLLGGSIGSASLIISSSISRLLCPLEFEMLLLDVVLADERLVLDDIDEPSDIVDFGLCTSVEVSLDDRTKLSRLWAITKKKLEF